MLLLSSDPHCTANTACFKSKHTKRLMFAYFGATSLPQALSTKPLSTIKYQPPATTKEEVLVALRHADNSNSTELLPNLLLGF